MGPNVKDNPMPSHGPSSVNNIEVCLNEQRVTKIEEIRRSLVEIHSVLCAHGLFQHDHQICGTCSVNSRGCRKIQDDLQGVLDQGLIQISRQVSSPESQEQEVNVIIPCFNIPEKVEIAYHPREPVVICPPGPMPYTSDKAVPYRYAATIIENGKEVEIKTLASVTNIAANSRMTRSGRVFAPPVIPSRNVEKDPVVVVPVTREAEGQTSNSTLDKETDELLRIIKLSDYKMVDQLLQTPSKISILSLLLNSAVHREALLKVLDQAFVEQDITAEQFNNVVGSITSCNGLGFCDEELPEEGKNHNFALHISANCQGDSLSNILIDTGSSLNVMPKSTLLKLKYKGGQMRHSGIIVKAFDGSRKTVIGEVDLPIGIGPHVFQITFQVMDIVPAYSCLLGRPWIHEAGAITSTLHQKLKFVKNGQIVTVNGEQAMLISHLSSFSVIEVDETVVQTPFQALTIDDYKKSEGSIASFKDAQQIVKTGPTEMWGKVIELPENVNHAGLGFVDGKQVQTSVVRPFKDIFHSGGFINMVAVEEDTFGKKTEDEGPRFVTPGKIKKEKTKKMESSLSQSSFTSPPLNFTLGRSPPLAMLSLKHSHSNSQTRLTLNLNRSQSLQEIVAEKKKELTSGDGDGNDGVRTSLFHLFTSEIFSDNSKAVSVEYKQKRNGLGMNTGKVLLSKLFAIGRFDVFGGFDVSCYCRRWHPRIIMTQQETCGNILKIIKLRLLST
ncbi:uncharacterized protein LOC127081170 [Lathyrus oleraceus]|uniref:uncharacterized protein LOC127081170 n=1 Tax=Pisum sativum TaxID=3888 RepID=UPI0021D08DB4|nr:uncharacterized protein LOC127081170 [Pisum sativum]